VKRLGLGVSKVDWTTSFDFVCIQVASIMWALAVLDSPEFGLCHPELCQHLAARCHQLQRDFQVRPTYHDLIACIMTS